MEKELETKPIAYGMIDINSYEPTLQEAAYRATGIVKMIHDHIDLRLTDKLAYSPSTMMSRVRVASNAGNHLLKKKTLLVNEKHLKYSETRQKVWGLRVQEYDKATFKELYGGKVRFVDEAFVEEAMMNNDEEYCYLLRIEGFREMLLVIDLETESIIFQTEDPGTVITKKEIKELSKAAR